VRDRIAERFAALREQGRSGLVCFLVGGDPDPVTFAGLLEEVVAAGADVVEIGMPFSDPMADGPVIQKGNLRALGAGVRLADLLEAVEAFRRVDRSTPIVLMGYYNPILAYGRLRFLERAREVGVDGLIVVDVPPEEDEELCLPALERELAFIRLVAPTTGEERLAAMLQRSAGFVYYVSLTGITGVGRPVQEEVAAAVARLRRHTRLPVAVGFGIREPQQARAIAAHADAVVVGSALVAVVEEHVSADADHKELIPAVGAKVRALREALEGVARR